MNIKYKVVWSERACIFLWTNVPPQIHKHKKVVFDPPLKLTFRTLCFLYIRYIVLYMRASKPFLSIISNSFLDAPAGFLQPCSHF